MSTLGHCGSFKRVVLNFSNVVTIAVALTYTGLFEPAIYGALSGEKAVLLAMLIVVAPPSNPSRLLFYKGSF